MNKNMTSSTKMLSVLLFIDFYHVYRQKNQITTIVILFEIDWVYNGRSVLPEINMVIISDFIYDNR